MMHLRGVTRPVGRSTVPPAGDDPATLCLRGRCSTLSYGGDRGPRGNRTRCLLLAKQALSRMS